MVMRNNGNNNGIKVFKCDVLIKNIKFNKTASEGHTFLKFNEEHNPEKIMCSHYFSEFEGKNNYCDILKGPCKYSFWQIIHKDGIDYGYEIKK